MGEVRVHHQCLRLDIDLDARHVEGVCTLWLYATAVAVAGEEISYRLHARQMAITSVKVNGSEVTNFRYPYPVDLLKDVTPPERQDGEAFDLYYRCQTTVSQEGELLIELPASGLPASVRESLACLEGVPEDARVYEVEVTYELSNPSAGLSFQSSPPHVYSVARTIAPYDVEGPRCWFPCSDRPSDLSTFELVCTVNDREATVLSGGKVLERNLSHDKDEVTWRYAINMPVTAKCLSLIAGRFTRYVDPSSPLFTHYYLSHRGDDDGDGDGGRRGSNGKKMGGVRQWISNSAGGTAPAVQFMADYFTLVSPPEHRVVYVKGAAEGLMAYHGLAIHRAESHLHPPNLFDPTMTTHLTLVEGYLASFLLPRLRPRYTRDTWILYGALGYLLQLYVRKRYGEDEYRYRLLAQMDATIALERNGGTLPLSPLETVTVTTELLSPRHLSLLRVKAPLVMHMIEHHAGRKPVRDVFRSTCVPATPEVDEEPVRGGGNGESRAARPVPVESIRTFSFLRRCTNSSTRGDAMRLLRQRWLEGSGVAFFYASYAFRPEKKSGKDKLPASVVITLKQVVPPWGRAFQGPVRVRIVEEEGTFEYDIEVKGADVTTAEFKVKSKIQKRTGGQKKRASAGGAASGGGGGEAAGIMTDEGTVTGDGTKPKKAKKAKKKLGDPPVLPDGGMVSGPSYAPPPSAPSPQPPDNDMVMDSEEQQLEEDQEVARVRLAQGCPVLWVQIDPDMQWIAEWEWDTDEVNLVEQLRKDNDAAGQCIALRHLARYPLDRETSASLAAPTLDRRRLVVEALSDCLRGKVRKGCVIPPLVVRVEAARALSVWQNRHCPVSGVLADRFSWPCLYEKLLGAFRERYFDRDGTVLLPNDFKDEADYQIKKAIIAAVARVRAPDGTTPYIVWEMLRIVLAYNDNTRNQFSDDYYLAHVLRSVCCLRMPAVVPYLENVGDRAKVLARMEEQVIRYLAWGLEVGSHDDVVPAAAIQAMVNIEMMRGGMPKFDYHKYASPKYSLRVRLAAIEAVVKLSLLGQGGQPGEGTEKAIKWTLAVLDREGDQGSLALKYWGLKTLLETIRRPIDYRPQSWAPVFAETSFVDHLDTTAPALDLIDPAYSQLGTAYVALPYPPPGGPAAPPPLPPRPPPSSPNSSFNPFVLSLRFPCASSLAVKAKVWSLINTRTWYSQPLRLLASNLHQYLWGYDPLQAPEPVAQPQATESPQQAQDNTDPLVKQIRDLRGLKEAYIAVLELRLEGAVALRKTFLDEREWRTMLPKAIEMASLPGTYLMRQQPQRKPGAKGGDHAGLGGAAAVEDADEEEAAEKQEVRRRLEIAQKASRIITFRIGGGAAAAASNSSNTAATTTAAAPTGSPPTKAAPVVANGTTSPP